MAFEDLPLIPFSRKEMQNISKWKYLATKKKLKVD